MSAKFNEGLIERSYHALWEEYSVDYPRFLGEIRL